MGRWRLESPPSSSLAGGQAEAPLHSPRAVPSWPPHPHGPQGLASTARGDQATPTLGIWGQRHQVWHMTLKSMAATPWPPTKALPRTKSARRGRQPGAWSLYLPGDRERAGRQPHCERRGGRHPWVWGRGWQVVSMKGQAAELFSFKGLCLDLSVCHWSSKASQAMCKESARLCANKTLFTKPGCGPQARAATC